jgi:putative phosphoesterase
MGPATAMGERMRIGIFSDVHGNAAALRPVLQDLTSNSDVLLFLGDLAGYYGFVNECADLWPAQVVGVRGNHDDVLLKALAEAKAPAPTYSSRYGSALWRSVQRLSPKARGLMEALPVQRTLDFDGLRVAMFHGSPWEPLDGRVYPDFKDWQKFDALDADIVLLGHTHYPMAQKHGQKLIVNPGSVGQARDSSGAACFAIFDTTSRTVELKRVGFDCGEVIRDAKEHDPELPYLWEVLTR